MDLPKSPGKHIREVLQSDPSDAGRMKAEKIADRLREELQDREYRLEVAREALKAIKHGPHSPELRRIASEALARINS